MITKKYLVAGVAVLAIVLAFGARSFWWPLSDSENALSSKAEAIELTWEDLIPDDFVQPENPLASMSQEEIDKLMDGSDESNAKIAKLQDEFNYAPVVDELDGKRVKIPAYVTPLEFDGQSKMKEFLLVPYVGACMHTPPPPANQIVYAKSRESITFDDVYAPIWAVGTIRTDTVVSNLAESGYRLEVETVQPYKEPE